MAALSVVAALAVVLSAVLAGRARAGLHRSALRRRVVGLRPTAGRRVTLAVASAAVRRWWPGRTQPGPADGLPGVLEDVARGVRAGSSLHQACADAAVTAGGPATGLAQAVAEANRGRSLADALAEWSARAARAEERLAAGALALAATAGGPQARAVDGVATTLRERHAVAAEVRAQSAQARLSAVVIGALPLVFLLWAVATNRRTAAFLIAGPAGWACLGVGAGLEVAGAVWMRRLLRGASP